MKSMDTINGIWGHDYLNLEKYLDTSSLAAIDDEICFALTQVDVGYTGGSHRTMGIVPPSLNAEPYIDYGEVIKKFDRREFAQFLSLSDEEEDFDLDRPGDYEFGEEREHPLSRRQMLFLKYRYGVYFPWKVFYEMIPTLNWEDKANGAGKSFTDEARELFPRTIDYVRRLPFREIGRCNILGLEANDEGTVHQDGNPDEREADHFITICPRGNKRVFLWDEKNRRRSYVEGSVYWFNDHGYHGVAADPFFRYSIRVDGVFEDDFYQRLKRDFRK
jgi:hypothetical protein